jgi:hypothetical protein
MQNTAHLLKMTGLLLAQNRLHFHPFPVRLVISLATPLHKTKPIPYPISTLMKEAACSCESMCKVFAPHPPHMHSIMMPKSLVFLKTKVKLKLK